MVDIVIGTKTNTAAADALIEQVKAMAEPEATLYLGYPVVSTATDSTTIDAMLTSPSHGVIIFDFFSPSDASDKNTVLAWIFHKQKRCTFLSESCPCIAVLTALSVYSDLWTGLRRVRRGECTAVNARTAALGRVASHEHVRG